MNQLFYNIFNPMETFFSRDMFADVMSVHNRNMKHAREIEFDETNLLAMLQYLLEIFSHFFLNIIGLFVQVHYRYYQSQKMNLNLLFGYLIW